MLFQRLAILSIMQNKKGSDELPDSFCTNFQYGHSVIVDGLYPESTYSAGWLLSLNS